MHICPFYNKIQRISKKWKMFWQRNVGIWMIYIFMFWNDYTKNYYYTKLATFHTSINKTSSTFFQEKDSKTLRMLLTTVKQNLEELLWLFILVFILMRDGIIWTSWQKSWKIHIEIYHELSTYPCLLLHVYMSLLTLLTWRFYLRLQCLRQMQLLW